MGKSKNNPANRNGTQKNVLVMSDTCEKCKTPCAKGQKYLENLKQGKAGNGCVCILLK